MKHVVVMPKLGLTMTEGKISRWHKQVGDAVALGEVLFEVETDKITKEIESTVSGILRKIMVEDGSVPVLQPVGIVADANEDLSDIIEEEPAAESETPNETKKKVSPKARRIAKELNVDLTGVIGTGPGNAITEADVRSASESTIKSTVMANQVADRLGVDLSKIETEKRIRKQDVYDHWLFEKMKETAHPVESVIEMSTMREVISERMLKSQERTATVHYNQSVNVSKLIKMRSVMKSKAHITFTDLFIKIVSMTLLDHPMLNGTIEDDSIRLRNYVNMGVAIALDDGLIVPVLKYANILSVGEISESLKGLANKARSDSLELESLTEGTFTITNLGMYGIDSFTPIINYPEVAILGLSAIKNQLELVDGCVEEVPYMTLCLGADHRIVDGSVAASFLADLKNRLENPELLLL